jgi:hypothetical protein
MFNFSEVVRRKQEYKSMVMNGIYCTLQRDSMATHGVRNYTQEKMSKVEYMAWKMRRIGFKLYY